MEGKINYPLGKTIKRMLKNVTANNKKIYLFFIIFTVTAVVYPFFSVALPKILINELSLGQAAKLENILIIVLAYFLLTSVFGYIKTYVLNYSKPMITLLRIDYVRDISDKLISFDYKYAEDAGFAEENERAFRACGSNDNGMEGVYHKLFETPAVFITTIVFIVFIGMLNVWILVGLIVNLIVTLLINRGVHHYTYKNKKVLSHSERRNSYYYRTTHDFGFGKDIRVYNFKNRILDNYSKEIEGYLAIHRKIKNKEYALGFLALFALLASDILTYGILIYKTANGMSIADFSMYITAIVSLSLMLKTLVQDLTAIYVEGQYVNDFYEFMDTDYGEKGGQLKAIQDDTLEIEFKNVSFKYPKTEKYIFKNLDFKINKGERLAIVGINGAGKTTLVKLMTGLFDVTDGEILINGVSIKNFDKKSLYSMFSVVFQEINVLAYTIRENIACSSVDVDDEKVWNALEKVGLRDKVLSFDKGLDQMMLKIIEEDGTEFSGGEKQKLAIARALYKDANMVIMDEPTAALDALAEAEIYENFSELVQGKTAVYISHRLASTKFCDKIALFDNDGLREYGNHDELMLLKGKYYEMFSIQGKYYKEGAEVTNE